MMTVVLVHGINTSDRFPPEFVWGRIPDTLRRKGYRVVFGGTDAVGTYESNAAQLNATLEAVCREIGGKVLVMAHSKGGIDTRYCLSRYDKGARIAGLVTVATPHLGSDVADAIIGHLPSPRAARLLSKTWGRFFPDRHPSFLDALRGLTTANLKRFNREVADVPGVYYRSCYTTMSHPWDDWSLSAPYRLLLAQAGPNDGVVSAASARWGADPFEIQGIKGGISHWDILDLKRRKISGVSIPDIWVELAENAARAL